jgi:hypothetical protein
VKRLSNDRGSALVEFALILPVFVLVVLGSMAFIWLIGARSAVTGATRDGARYASIQHDWLDCPVIGVCDTAYPTQAEVESYVRDRAGMFGGDAIDVDVTPTDQPERNEVITVRASRKLPPLFGSFAHLLGIDEITYTSTAVARAE